MNSIIASLPSLLFSISLHSNNCMKFDVMARRVYCIMYNTFSTYVCHDSHVKSVFILNANSWRIIVYYLYKKIYLIKFEPRKFMSRPRYFARAPMKTKYNFNACYHDNSLKWWPCSTVTFLLVARKLNFCSHPHKLLTSFLCVHISDFTFIVNKIFNSSFSFVFERFLRALRRISCAGHCMFTNWL